MPLSQLKEKFTKNERYHLGQMFMDCIRNIPSEAICQIDAATGEQETFGSMLSRSIQVARCLRNLVLQPGDVLALGGKNHLDLHIPYYAALFNGLPIVGIDPYFKCDEIKKIFEQTEPKIAFCDYETEKDYARAAEELGLDVKIVTFRGGECTLQTFMETYDDKDARDEDFQPADFDPRQIYAWLVCTSGTTGTPKVAAFEHRVLMKQAFSYLRITEAFSGVKRSSSENRNGEPIKVLNLSPVQWFSGFSNAVVIPITNRCKLQTSKPENLEHIIDIINKYKPTSLFSSPALLISILKNKKECDLTCFNDIILTGSKIYADLLAELKVRLRPDAALMEAYAQTEGSGLLLIPNPRGPVGSCGTPMPGAQVKLVDPNTGEEITEPNVPGEMWTKGGALFAEYYKNPEATAQAFSEDGWYKTGDLFYRDQNFNFYFVDRLKLLLKYRSYHVSPPELEEVISRHKGVQEVAVTGISDPEDGQHPVACVVRTPGSDVTAQEIKDLVADKLSASKHLRGGVVFVEELPKTSTGKVNQAKLKEMVIAASRE